MGTLRTPVNLFKGKIYEISGSQHTQKLNNRKEIRVKKNDKSMQRELNTNFWWPRLLHNQSLFIALQGGRGVEDIGRDHMVFSGNRGRTSRRLKAMKGNHGKLTTNEEGGRGGDHKKFAEPYGGHVT